MCITTVKGLKDNYVRVRESQEERNSNDVRKSVGERNAVDGKI